ncbi:indole-3-glycerol phosphate synthase TrpC [Thermogemmatispora sp.]|uniref:indole-3-glycerol phosphate synthase TrpC n=1 Tax=Thermogemmatispora sp. TaxID=1968838 RepID=UPI001D6A5A25|nr:indole-3-glycerol phosphate synthase TrpC [Thermogemmatispora sp.]MBX5449528.1 indole-3-glycerol phosphate synthase TrpC [Thermogemmatispora sp.]
MFLERILARTRCDLEERRRLLPLERLRELAAAQPPARDFAAALRPQAGEPGLRLIAEIKRASPSKGPLAPDLDPVALARTYEAAGAAAISVLTEPHFFLGAPEHLTAVKKAVSLPVLRKDFIVDEYQVYEARAWGADALLLICAALTPQELMRLLRLTRDLGMEALVEVHSAAETEMALAAGARVIGVNSRDLVTFNMNPFLIRELRRLIPADRILVAESGIHSEGDARRLRRYDVHAMLVGESLVKAGDVQAQIKRLLWGANGGIQVKICGLRSAEALRTAIESGADLLGLMFYPRSKRYLEPSQARRLLAEAGYLALAEQGQVVPDLVGVFVNEEISRINEIAEELDLHFVQLHGEESPELCASLRHPVLKAVPVYGSATQEEARRYRAVAWRVLLDTPTAGYGGSGRTHDWEVARTIAAEQPIILAGGLTPANVAEAIATVRPWGVDVSSGVESNGEKDAHKIRAFIEAVRQSSEQFPAAETVG